MDEDTILGLGVLITWVVGIICSLALTGFICWAIYRLVIYFT